MPGGPFLLTASVSDVISPALQMGIYSSNSKPFLVPSSHRYRHYPGVYFLLVMLIRASQMIHTQYSILASQITSSLLKPPSLVYPAPWAPQDYVGAIDRRAVFREINVHAWNWRVGHEDSRKVREKMSHMHAGLYFNWVPVYAGLFLWYDFPFERLG